MMVTFRFIAVGVVHMAPSTGGDAVLVGVHTFPVPGHVTHTTCDTTGAPSTPHSPHI